MLPVLLVSSVFVEAGGVELESTLLADVLLTLLNVVVVATGVVIVAFVGIGAVVVVDVFGGSGQVIRIRTNQHTLISNIVSRLYI